MNTKVQKFMQYAINKLLCYNRGILLQPTKRIRMVSDTIDSNGAYDEERKMLGCATGKPIAQWLPIFIHEFGHFTQQIEHMPMQKKFLKLGDKYDIFKLMDNKRSMKKVSDKIWHDTVMCYRDMEFECEKVALGLIKQFKLQDTVSIEYYTKCANAYILFYNIIDKYRKFYKKAPYEVAKIMDMMPSSALKSYDVMPIGYEKLVKKYCL
jgi:hypothetical protein